MNNQVLVEHDYAAAMALLRNALAPSADVVAADPGTSGWDAEIVRSGSAPIRLRFRSGKTATGQGASPGDVWVLNRPLKGELQHLRERGQNFVALNGTVRIVEQWLLLERSGLAPRRSQQSGTSKRTDPFADRNSLIPRALLAHPERVWGVRELATTTGVALGTASQVVHALARSDTVRYERSGRAARVWVESPARLLRWWLAGYTWERNEKVAFHAPMGDPDRFIRRLPQLGSRWALTLQAGASLVAPHATWERVHAYVDVATRAELVQAGRAQGWTPADDGTVILMKPWYRTSVWNDLAHVGEIPVVSTLQLVLDLWHYPLRGREQAEHLLSTALNISWQ